MFCSPQIIQTLDTSEGKCNIYRCTKCKGEWGDSYGERPVCNYREPEPLLKPETHEQLIARLCTEDKCNRGHECTSSCRKTQDCACLDEHDVMTPAKNYALENEKHTFLFNAFNR